MSLIPFAPFSFQVSAFQFQSFSFQRFSFSYNMISTVAQYLAALQELA